MNNNMKDACVQAKPPSNVERACDDLTVAIEKTASLAVALGEKLTPVMAPPYPADDLSGDKEQDECSSHTMYLRQKTRELRAIQGCLNEYLERVEL